MQMELKIKGSQFDVLDALDEIYGVRGLEVRRDGVKPLQISADTVMEVLKLAGDVVSLSLAIAKLIEFIRRSSRHRPSEHEGVRITVNFNGVNYVDLDGLEKLLRELRVSDGRDR